MTYTPYNDKIIGKIVRNVRNFGKKLTKFEVKFEKKNVIYSQNMFTNSVDKYCVKFEEILKNF